MCCLLNLLLAINIHYFLSLVLDLLLTHICAWFQILKKAAHDLSLARIHEVIVPLLLRYFEDFLDFIMSYEGRCLQLCFLIAVQGLNHYP